ncbi:hypothetical protein DFH11DRAFT_1880872 [Phellopilus nigrolimitatus]|nr:hypothetical protein DFH11DRAFT_1880872 [Phellopilus nigrolimitatus]
MGFPIKKPRVDQGINDGKDEVAGTEGEVVLDSVGAEGRRWRVDACVGSAVQVEGGVLEVEGRTALNARVGCELKKTPYTIYGNEAFDVVAIVSHPEGEVPVLTKLLASRNGVLNSVINVFAAISSMFSRRRIVAELDNLEGSPPVLSYPVYYS